jgi:hypothetical protein
MIHGPRPITAVFFDVDFTLIYPGPTFQGEGYRQFCAAHGVEVDPARFIAAVLEASPILHDDQELAYNDDVFIRYTRRIIEVMRASMPPPARSTRSGPPVTTSFSMTMSPRCCASWRAAASRSG